MEKITQEPNDTRMLVPIVRRGIRGTRPHVMLMGGLCGYICEYVRIEGSIDDPRNITRDDLNPNACILTLREKVF